RFDAPTALRIGLVHEVAGDVDAALALVLEELLSGGPEAVRAAKRLIRERPNGEEAADVAAKLRAGAEGQEGLRAFLERRTPRSRLELDRLGRLGVLDGVLQQRVERDPEALAVGVHGAADELSEAPGSGRDLRPAHEHVLDERLDVDLFDVEETFLAGLREQEQ